MNADMVLTWGLLAIFVLIGFLWLRHQAREFDRKYGGE